MNQTAQGTTKVTFEFPGGGKQTFEASGFVGAMTLKQDARGAQMGAFATGTFTPATITGLATAVMEAVAKEMMNQGMPPEGVVDVLLQILPHAVDSAAVREIDAQMDKLEKHIEQMVNSDDPMAKAVAQLLTLLR